jgi:conjugal transfer pilus assembly protein TraW
MIMMVSSFARDTRVVDTCAIDFGVMGETFSIQEEDLREVIKARLLHLERTGELKKHQQYLSKTAVERVKRPAPVRNVHNTTQPRTFEYDPSITVSSDLKDDKGRVFQPKGKRINPLDTIKLSKNLIFLDGDDQAQVSWALSLPNDPKTLVPKLILVNGSPWLLEEKHKRRFYFDKGGALTAKLKIQQVPARVSQSDKQLKIEELLLEELQP